MLKRLPHSVPLIGSLVWLVVLLLVTATGGLNAERAEAASRPGLTYGGTTSQRENVFLRKSRNRRQLVRFYADWSASRTRCTNGREYFGFTLLDPDLTGRTGIGRSGRFSKRDIYEDRTSDGSVREEANIAGRFRGKRVRGYFRVRVIERNPAGVVTNQCDTARVRWSAVD
jgi:hypothetical protein